MTKTLTALTILTASLAAPAFAQRLGVSVGYSRMTGPIGNQDSNEGIAVRVAAELNSGSLIRFGIEAGMDRLNENRRSFMTSCFHPAGGIATCYYNSTDRDTGLSLAATLRAGPRAGQVQPYILAGLGVLSVRTRSSSRTTDSTGAHLPNLEFQGTHSEGALIAPLGAGVLFRPAGSPVGFGVEARMTPLLYGDDGGPWLSWNPSLVLSVRW